MPEPHHLTTQFINNPVDNLVVAGRIDIPDILVFLPGVVRLPVVERNEPVVRIHSADAQNLIRLVRKRLREAKRAIGQGPPVKSGAELRRNDQILPVRTVDRVFPAGQSRLELIQRHTLAGLDHLDIVRPMVELREPLLVGPVVPYQEGRF